MKTLIATFFLTALLATVASAANVDARLSAREAYVGSPVVLQIAISDAADYEPPTLPSIDGCDVRSAGSPSQSSQITIINGRRSASRSVTMQYLITPRREGTFTIPPMTLKIDGKTVITQAQRFVATKSELGDLMFVEIEGGKESVFVGQPLDLTLKLWIKPFRDPRLGQTLSEGDMWNMVSDSTSWGGFTERMKTMAKNRQRPGGEEVLRDDGNGGDRAYYLYEIDATVYPKRAGKIDASDVQIIVNYPTAIGKSRSTFGSIFDNDMFGGSSLMSRMMNDDFFGSSFGNRLAVTNSRPIVGEVSVDATKVLPVPTEGRPADYRGAVGKYEIVTQAAPTNVDAGDPITLNIGIVGTGPMELVQAPPLFKQSDLAGEFKVADESLAGFVKNDSKVFSTTIRPKREGITEIPAIRFSFFDPETQQFQTVTSDPIAITVNEAETLALDAIVGNARGAAPGTTGPTSDANLPDFTNHSGTNVLMSRAPRGQSHFWWAFVIVSPIVFFVTFITKYRTAIADRLPSFRLAKAKCLTAIEHAKDQVDIAEALTRFVFARTRKPQREGILSRSGTRGIVHYGELSIADRSIGETEAVGRLRTAGLYQVASEVESFLAIADGSDLESLTSSATKLVERVDTAINANYRNKVKTTAPVHSRMKMARPVALFLATTMVASATSTTAFAKQHSPSATPAREDRAVEIILEEATEFYNQGIAKASNDAATAKELIATATEKYELLVDSGIHNTEMFTNLANAYMQTGKLGHAIANYEKALRFDPQNTQASENLRFAIANVTGVQTERGSANSIRSANNVLTDTIGARSIIWVLAFSSITFWGLMIVWIRHRPFAVWKCAATPLVLLLISLASVGLTETNAKPTCNAVIVAENVSLHTGDGEGFPPIITLESAQGHRVETLTNRGDWTLVRTADGYSGWVQAKNVEAFDA